MSAHFTVVLRVFTPAPIRSGWAWAPWEHQDPVGTEPARDIAELPRLIRTYARAASLLLREVARFQITCFGAKSGRVYGRDTWIYDPHCRALRPHGDPWVPLLDQRRDAVSQPPVASLTPPTNVIDLGTHVYPDADVRPIRPLRLVA